MAAMPSLVVASTNPVKIQAAVNGFQRLFPGSRLNVTTVAVPSGVAQQPMTDEETLRGALKRAVNAQALHPDADYWIGIEGGIEPIGQELTAFAWIVVRSKSMIGRGRAGTFFLPPAVAELIRQGKELGEADDIIFGRSNSKQDNGAVGLLTDNVINRAQLYEHALILALIPFKNERLYTQQGSQDQVVSSVIPNAVRNTCTHCVQCGVSTTDRQRRRLKLGFLSRQQRAFGMTHAQH